MADVVDVGKNIQRLREIGDISQSELALNSGLSRAAINAIESGESSPRLETLARIAAALRVGLDDLMRPSKQRRRIRFRSDRRLTTRREIIARVSRVLDVFDELETKLGIYKGAAALDRLRAAVPASGANLDAGPQLAAETRQIMGLDPHEPIADLSGVLERNGIRVLAASVATDGFFGLSAADDVPAIAVNTWDRISVERRIFSAVHELGHLIADADDYDVDQMDEDKPTETRADRFASYFLMPENAFKAAWAASAGLSLMDRTIKVKRIFRVSYKTVLMRVSDELGGDRGVWPAFYREQKRRSGQSLPKTVEVQPLPDEAFSTTRRAEEPDPLSNTDFMDGRMFALAHQAVNEHKITRGRATELLRIELKDFNDRADGWCA